MLPWAAGSASRRRRSRRSTTTRRARSSATRRRWRSNTPTRSRTRAATSTTSSSRACTALRRRHHRGADDDHRVGERVLALQPGVPHPIARLLEAGLTREPRHGVCPPPAPGGWHAVRGLLPTHQCNRRLVSATFPRSLTCLIAVPYVGSLPEDVQPTEAEGGAHGLRVRVRGTHGGCPVQTCPPEAADRVNSVSLTRLVRRSWRSTAGDDDPPGRAGCTARAARVPSRLRAEHRLRRAGGAGSGPPRG